jgi:periplasmic glucans biosynthesis protein
MKRLQTAFMSLCIGTASLGGPSTIAGAQPVQEPLSFFETLRQQAKSSAGESYREPDHSELPQFLRDLDYDTYQGIRFWHDEALWYRESLRFQVQFFHPGFLFLDPVRIQVLEDGKARELQFSPDLFDYGHRHLPEPVPDGLYFTGLRLSYPLSHASRLQEVAAFHGSSYFRLIGAHQIFGASARGLAIDTAEPGGEEFPRFTEFWVEKPGPLADHIRLFARLESRRVTGAYQFLFRPGDPSRMTVEASVFLREAVGKLGVAPLTSMFLFGENRDRHFRDFRPEVHDSDGLLFETGEGWFWRPLENPPRVHRVTVFPNPVAFGLMQRDRNPGHYQDLQARYHDRPSFWITPRGNWGPGRLELVEIPTPDESNDNIVAYWIPDQELQAGQELQFRYTIHAGRLSSDHPPASLWHVHATRLQPGEDAARMRFIVDWDSHLLPLLGAESVKPQVHASGGKIENVVAQPNDFIDGWRTFFDLVAEGNEPIELRLWLEQEDRKVSETWIYHFDWPR